MPADTGADHARTQVFAERARTFSFAARFLPPEQHDATLRLYSFFRALDDLMDEQPGRLTTAQKLDELEGWRGWLAGQPVPRHWGEISAAIEPVVDRYVIPRWIFAAFLDGMATDAGPVRIRSFEELYCYSFRVAGTVGLAMAYVLGATTPAALRCAANLGVAMQLTNILRDIGSDLARDRVYLPSEELAMFGYSSGRLFDLWQDRAVPDEVFDALLGFQIARARGYYARGLAGVAFLPLAARPTILIAGRLYRAILDRIACDRGATLYRRAATSRWHKLREAAQCLLLLQLQSAFPPAAGAEEWRDGPELDWLDLALDDQSRPMPLDSQVA